MAVQNKDRVDGRRDALVDAAHVSYVPATPGDWTSGDPGNVADALDEARETGGTALDAHIATSTDPHGPVLAQSESVQSPVFQNQSGNVTLAGTNVNIVGQNVSGDATVAILNISSGKVANLSVDGSISVGGTVDGRDIAVDGTILDTAVLETDVAAKGDIFVATANDVLTNLGVGANAQVLTADSAQASGVKWANPAPTWTQVTGKLFQVDKTFYASDFIQTWLSVAYFPAKTFPNGVTVVHVSIRLPQDIAYSLPFVRYTVANVTQTIKTVATTSGERFKAVEDGDIDNPDIPADHWIMVNLPVTDVPWVSVCVIVSVDDS